MIDVCSHMKGEIVGYSYANTTPHWKDNKKGEDLNRKLRPSTYKLKLLGQFGSQLLSKAHRIPPWIFM